MENFPFFEKVNEWNGLCRCGHLHSQHNPHGDHNYSASRCNECECKNFCLPSPKTTDKTTFFCTCFDSGVFDIHLDCPLHASITVQYAIEFAQFFWANVKGECTNDVYENQRGEKVSAKDMYMRFTALKIPSAVDGKTVNITIRKDINY